MDSIDIIRRKNRINFYLVCALMSTIIVILSILMMTLGNTNYSLYTVFEVLMGNSIKGATFTIMELRLPRMLGAIICGIAFGISGYIFQTLLSNPLASPDIIGVTSGSSVAAVFAILFLGLEGTFVSIVAVIAGILVSAFIYIISNHGGFSNSKMILTGIGFQAFLMALLSWLLLISSEYDVAKALHWISGSINDVSMDNLPVLYAVVILCSIVLIYFERHLKVLELGDEYAKTLGLNLNKSRITLVFLAIVLISFATSVSGPLSSVSFLSAPISTRILKSGRDSALIPSGFVGAILVMASDIVGQNMFAVRYPVGIITGILGAPYLIFVLTRINKEN